MHPSWLQRDNEVHSAARFSAQCVRATQSDLALQGGQAGHGERLAHALNKGRARQANERAEAGRDRGGRRQRAHTVCGDRCRRKARHRRAASRSRSRGQCGRGSGGQPRCYPDAAAPAADDSRSGCRRPASRSGRHPALRMD
eukprot:118714-Prymnesium_polylepis.1